MFSRILSAGIVPRHRFMAAYEQHVEAPDRRWQYIMFAAEPYETIAFKIPSREVDKGLAALKGPAPSVPERPATLDNLNLDVTSTGFWSFWNRDTKQLFVQIPFKLQQDPRALQILKVRMPVLILSVLFVVRPITLIESVSNEDRIDLFS